MKWYPWLRPHFEQLIGSYQVGRGHHALLIQALPGMGDDALIYAITRFLMCQQPEGHKSCGKCRGCQLMQAGTHPDYYTLEPEKGKNTLGIDAVREVSEKLYEYARLGGESGVAERRRAAHGSRSQRPVKNPGRAAREYLVFLSCREPERLLATLRSRCRLHHLAVPQEFWALAWLEREVTVSQDAARSALRLCSGAPAAALALLQPEVWSQRETLCRAVESALDSHDWLSVLPALNSDQAPERLHWLAALLLDALKIQQGATLLTNPDVWALVTTLANRLSGQSLHAILHDICQSREQLLTVTGLNRELLLTDQLLRIEHYLQPGVIPPVSHL